MAFPPPGTMLPYLSGAAAALSRDVAGRASRRIVAPSVESGGGLVPGWGAAVGARRLLEEGLDISGGTIAVEETRQATRAAPARAWRWVWPCLLLATLAVLVPSPMAMLHYGALN